MEILNIELMESQLGFVIFKKFSWTLVQALSLTLLLPKVKLTDLFKQNLKNVG